MRAQQFLALILVGGCARASAPAPSIPQWAVSATPTLTIGAGEAPAGHELSKVSGARMQNGLIIVASTGSNELQRFDTTGALLGSEGRKGNGPGEFTGSIGLSPAPGDSLYVFDSENLRWSIHDGTGRYARTLSGGANALARPVLLYHRTMIRSAADAPVPAWMLALLDSLPQPAQGAPARQARIDDPGFLWVQDSASTGVWSVYAGAGPAVGRVALPRGFELLQEGRDFVLGRAVDSTDQEVVRVYRLARPSNLTVASSLPAGTVPANDRTSQNQLFADINGVVTTQEMFYSNHGAYTADSDSLGAKLGSGAELILLAGDKRHWAGLFYDRVTGATCGVAVGFPQPDGWLDGTAFCGR